MRNCNKKIFFSIVIIIILMTVPIYSFSQTDEKDQSKLLLQLRKSKPDTSRVHLYQKLGQNQLNKTDKLKKHSDSALYFADKMFYLSQALKYESGKNDANLLRGNCFLRNNDIKSTLNLLRILQDSTRLRFLIVLNNYYLFKTNRSKTNTDSSLIFLKQADEIAKTLPEKWQNESLRARAIFAFKTGNAERGKKLFKQLIDKISKPGNKETEAGLWKELAMLIKSRDKTDITRMYCFERMVALYKKAGREEKEIETLKSIADMNLVQGRLYLAETQLLNVLQRYKAIGYPKLYYVYDLLGGTYRNKGDYSKAIFYGLKAIESMEATHDTVSATTFYSRLANTYRELGQHKKSVEWYWKVFRNREYTETVNQYMFRDAGFLVRELVKLKREREALAFILDINAKNKPNGVHAKASLLASLAYCYHAMKQHQLADRYYLELVKLTGGLEKDNEITTDVHYEIGQYFMDKQQYGKAASYLQEALNAAQGINNLSEIKGIYMMLYKSDSAIGNYKSAMQYLMKHKILNDSIFNETKSRQIEELQVKYETEKKKKDIELLNSQNQQANKIKNITLTVAALLLIIIGLLYNRYLTKQRSNRKLEAHQKELDEKNTFLETLNTEQTKLLKEKEWLIGEVHHRVKNNLQMVTSLLNTQSAYLKDDAAVLAVKDSLRRMQAMSLIHQKLYEDQNTTSIAMPEYISDLVNYLRESFNIGNRIGFEQSIEPLYLDVLQAIPLGLIINESIVNSIKHAFVNGQGGNIYIDLRCDGTDYFLLKISDNGVGLLAGLHVLENNSLGLDLIQGLTKQLKGSFTIESNKGVHVTVRFITLKK